MFHFGRRGRDILIQRCIVMGDPEIRIGFYQSLIEQLLSDRDAEFRRAVKAGRQLKELSDVKRMQADYEAGPAEKDKASRSATGLWVQGKPDCPT